MCVGKFSNRAKIYAIVFIPPIWRYKRNRVYTYVHSQSASLLANERGALGTALLARKADGEEQHCKTNRIIENTQNSTVFTAHHIRVL